MSQIDRIINSLSTIGRNSPDYLDRELRSLGISGYSPTSSVPDILASLSSAGLSSLQSRLDDYHAMWQKYKNNRVNNLGWSESQVASPRVFTAWSGPTRGLATSATRPDAIQRDTFGTRLPGQPIIRSNTRKTTYGPPAFANLNAPIDDQGNVSTIIDSSKTIKRLFKGQPRDLIINGMQSTIPRHSLNSTGYATPYTATPVALIMEPPAGIPGTGYWDAAHNNFSTNVVSQDWSGTRPSIGATGPKGGTITGVVDIINGKGGSGFEVTESVSQQVAGRIKAVGATKSMLSTSAWNMQSGGRPVSGIMEMKNVEAAVMGSIQVRLDMGGRTAEKAARDAGYASYAAAPKNVADWGKGNHHWQWYQTNENNLIQDVSWDVRMHKDRIPQLHGMIQSIADVKGMPHMFDARMKASAYVDTLPLTFQIEEQPGQLHLNDKQIAQIATRNPAYARQLVRAGAATRTMYKDIVTTSLGNQGFRARPNSLRYDDPQVRAAIDESVIAAQLKNPGVVGLQQGTAYVDFLDSLAGSSIGKRHIEFPSVSGNISTITPSSMARLADIGDPDMASAIGRAGVDLLTNTDTSLMEGLVKRYSAEELIVATGPDAVKRTRGSMVRSDTGLISADKGIASVGLGDNEVYIPHFANHGLYDIGINTVRAPLSGGAAAFDANRSMVLLSRQEAINRKMNPDVAAFPPQVVQMVQGDTDGDIFYGLKTGLLKVVNLGDGKYDLKDFSGKPIDRGQLKRDVARMKVESGAEDVTSAVRGFSRDEVKQQLRDKIANQHSYTQDDWAAIAQKEEIFDQNKGITYNTGLGLEGAVKLGDTDAMIAAEKFGAVGFGYAQRPQELPGYINDAMNALRVSSKGGFKDINNGSLGRASLSRSLGSSSIYVSNIKAAAGLALAEKDGAFVHDVDTITSLYAGKSRRGQLGQVLTAMRNRGVSEASLQDKQEMMKAIGSSGEFLAETVAGRYAYSHAVASLAKNMAPDLDARGIMDPAARQAAFSSLAKQLFGDVPNGLETARRVMDMPLAYTSNKSYLDSNSSEYVSDKTMKTMESYSALERLESGSSEPLRIADYNSANANAQNAQNAAQAAIATQTAASTVNPQATTGSTTPPLTPTAGAGGGAAGAAGGGGGAAGGGAGGAGGGNTPPPRHPISIHELRRLEAIRFQMRTYTGKGALTSPIALSNTKFMAQYSKIGKTMQEYQQIMQGVTTGHLTGADRQLVDDTENYALSIGPRLEEIEDYSRYHGISEQGKMSDYLQGKLNSAINGGSPDVRMLGNDAELVREMSGIVSSGKLNSPKEAVRSGIQLEKVYQQQKSDYLAAISGGDVKRARELFEAMSSTADQLKKFSKVIDDTVTPMKRASKILNEVGPKLSSVLETTATSVDIPLRKKAGHLESIGKRFETAREEIGDMKAMAEAKGMNLTRSERQGSGLSWWMAMAIGGQADQWMKAGEAEMTAYELRKNRTLMYQGVYGNSLEGADALLETPYGKLSTSKAMTDMAQLKLARAGWEGPVGSIRQGMAEAQLALADSGLAPLAGGIEAAAPAISQIAMMDMMLGMSGNSGILIGKDSLLKRGISGVKGLLTGTAGTTAVGAALSGIPLLQAAQAAPTIGAATATLGTAGSFAVGVPFALAGLATGSAILETAKASQAAGEFSPQLPNPGNAWTGAQLGLANIGGNFGAVAEMFNGGYVGNLLGASNATEAGNAFEKLRSAYSDTWLKQSIGAMQWQAMIPGQNGVTELTPSEQYDYDITNILKKNAHIFGSGDKANQELEDTINEYYRGQNIRRGTPLTAASTKDVLTYSSQAVTNAGIDPSSYMNLTSDLKRSVAPDMNEAEWQTITESLSKSSLGDAYTLQQTTTLGQALGLYSIGMKPPDKNTMGKNFGKFVEGINEEYGINGINFIRGIYSQGPEMLQSVAAILNEDYGKSLINLQTGMTRKDEMQLKHNNMLYEFNRGPGGKGGGYQDFQYAQQVASAQRNYAYSYGNFQGGSMERLAAVQTSAQAEGQSTFAYAQQVYAQQGTQGASYVQSKQRREWQKEDLQHEQAMGAMRKSIEDQIYGLRRKLFQDQRKWQEEDFKLQKHKLEESGQREMIQRQWQQEDWAVQQNVSAVQYGWQMEDFDEAIRYANGRQKKGLQKQKERATWGRNVEQAKFEREKSRTQQQWGWSDDDLKHAFDELKKQERQAKEVYEVNDQIMQLQKTMADAEYAASQGSAARQMTRYKTEQEWEDAQFLVQSEHDKAQYDAQLASIAKAKEYQDLLNTIEDEQKKMMEDMAALNAANAKSFIDMVIELISKMNNGGGGLPKGEGSDGSSDPGDWQELMPGMLYSQKLNLWKPVPITSTPSGPGEQKANGGFVNGEQQVTVGEAGPELILPLTKPARMKQLMEQAGLKGGSNAGSQSFTTPEGLNVQVIVTPTSKFNKYMTNQMFPR